MAAESKAAKAAERQAQLELKETAKREREEQLGLRKESTEARQATKSNRKVVDRLATTVVEGGG